MARTVVIGAGPVGIFLAVLLSQKGETVLVVRDDMYPSLSSQRLRISGALSITANEQEPKVLAWRGGEIPVAEDDLVFVCTKAYDVLPVLQELRPKLSTRNITVLCANGLGLYHDAQDRFGNCTTIVRLLARFGVRGGRDGETILSGSFGAIVAGVEDHACEHVVGKLSEQGFRCDRAKDPEHAEWQKALINLPVNAVATLMGERNAIILNNLAARQIALAVFSEACRIAEYRKCDVSYATKQWFLSALEPYGENVNSMLVDIRRGRRMEIAWLHERALAWAQEGGIEVPCLRVCTMLLRELARRVSDDTDALR